MVTIYFYCAILVIANFILFYTIKIFRSRFFFHLIPME